MAASATELELGLRLFKANQLDAAAEACARHLAAMPRDARALHLLGLVRLKAGAPVQALEHFEAAARLEPANVQIVLSLGSAYRASGNGAGAVAAFERAVALDPASGTAHFNLALAHRDAGRLRESVLEFRAAARADPADFEAMQNLVETLGRAVRAGETPFAAGTRGAPPDRGSGICVVVCSIDDAKLARFRANFDARLAGRPHEIIAIRDARSLCEGFNRGLDSARHPIVVFCHDDIELLSHDAFARVEAALANADVVGFAGSRNAGVWAGHPHLHGWMTHPAAQGGGWEAAVMSLECGVVGGMQALDGVFMATRRELAQRLRFDERTFDGFHLYDSDFSYRAFLAGLRLAITTDVQVLHASRGRFDESWRKYAQRFQDKFPELAAVPRTPAHWYGATFDDVAHAGTLFSQLRAMSELP